MNDKILGDTMEPVDSGKIVEKKVIPLLSEMIRNRCVNNGSPASGNETKSAETLKSFFNSYGIDSEILFSKPNRGNLLVRIPGTDPSASSLMFMGHMDVVPADRNRWSCDPFKAVIKDGYIYGRGCVDMLNITAASAVAFAERISQKGAQRGDMIFLAVADEESSGLLGARWLVENHLEKVRVDYMITELGGFFIDGRKGPCITISVGEKGVAWVRLSVKGTAGHGSMPYNSDNAFYKILKAGKKIADYKEKPVITPQYKTMVRHLVKRITTRLLCNSSSGLKKGLKQIFSGNPGKARILHAASRMTINPGRLEAGRKINIIPDRGFIDLDIRILPGQTKADIREILEKILGELADKVSIDFIDFFPSNISPDDTTLMGATRKILNRVYPGVDLAPVMMSAVSDGRYWRQHGTVVYGFALFDDNMTFSEYSKMLHGVNERISISSLEKTYDYFYSLPGEFY